ncbi:MAG: hypothetical protein II812_07015, partial [Prevotella sp.]|nr:hypothetical protein [Prevotella sp.]
MKKNLITVLAGICLSALDAEAQQLPADISITVERTELKTERIFNEQEHRYVDYQGTELHAGHIRASFQVMAENPNLSNPGFPDNPVFEVSYADPYGHVFSQSDTGIMTDV